MPATPDAARLVTCPPDEFRRAGEAALATARSGIERLKSLPAPRNTREALELFDEATAALSDASARASVVRHSHPDEPMRQASEAAEQEAEKLATEISLDRGVYEVIASLDVSQEDAPTRKWVEKLLRDFRRAGVDRDDATRARVTALQEELVRIGQEFGRNIREDVRTVELSPDGAGRPARGLRARPPAGRGRQGASSPPTTRTGALHDVREGLRGARELWRPTASAAYPAEPGGARAAPGAPRTSWPRCSATRTGPPTPPRTR